MPQPTLTEVQNWFAALDPKVPLVDADDPRQVDLDANEDARRGDALPFVDALLRTMRLADQSGRSRQLVTGPWGCGKTTELRRLQHRLEAADSVLPSRVVWIDAEQYIDRYAPPGITDLLLVLAYAIDREARSIRGQSPDGPDSLVSRIGHFLQSDVTVTGLTLSAPGVDVMGEIKANASFRQRVRERLEASFQAFAKEARTSIAQSVADIASAKGGQRVVVIVDGLEKFQALNVVGAKEMASAVEAVFLSHGEWLELPCHVIYSIPLWLRWRTAALGGEHDSSPITLPNLKLCNQEGTENAPGIDALVRLLGRRMDLDKGFGGANSPVLHHLLRASGGYLRDALRLARDAVREAQEFPIRPEVAERIIRRLGAEYEVVALRSDLGLLAQIAAEKVLPEGEEAQANARELMERFLVLLYRNGDEWVDVHPVLAQRPRIKARFVEILGSG